MEMVILCGKEDNPHYKITSMEKLGVIDLEILYLGIKENRSFNEKDIENSELKRLGVGRILDSLASLKERKLIDLNNDGSFSVTDFAKSTLWNNDVPSQLKILRLLEIKSCRIEEISKFLKKSESDLIDEIERLRKNQWILMLPIRQESTIIKTYEILPDGIDEIKRAEKDGLQISNTDETKIEILKLVEMIIQEISQESHDVKRHTDIILKLNQIKEKLQLL